jgi:hypothetical protein
LNEDASHENQGSHVSVACPQEDVIKAGLTMDNGWVPMDKLVDCFISTIIDEDQRGHSYVVAGSAGKAVRYPRPLVVDREVFYERSEEEKKARM